MENKVIKAKDLAVDDVYNIWLQIGIVTVLRN